MQQNKTAKIQTGVFLVIGATNSINWAIWSLAGVISYQLDMLVLMGGFGSVTAPTPKGYTTRVPKHEFLTPDRMADENVYVPYLVAGANVNSIFQELKDFIDVSSSGGPQETGVAVRLEWGKHIEVLIRECWISLFQSSMAVTFIALQELI